LAKKGKLNPFVMILSDNNTKLSGRIDQDSFDMNPSFESLKTLGFELIKIEDGHDLPTVYMAIEEAVELARQNPHKPICLWAKTIKGKGVKSTETSASGGHGYPLSPYDEKLENFIQEIFHQQAPTELVVWAKELATKPTAKTTSTVKKEKVQKGIAKALIECAEAGLPVFSISADLQGSTGVKDFQQKFPENYLEVGVAESNMVSVAVGFAKAGFIPVVDTFAQFGVTKGNLPLTMASLSQGPVIGIFSHTGFQDAADGASHQATTYLAAVAAIPHLESVVCATSAEAYEYLKQTIKKYAHERSAGNDGVSTLFFIGREDFVPQFPVPVTYEWGKAQILHDEKEADVVLVASGPMTHKIWEAKDYFIANGKKAIIINHPFVNHPDIHTIGEALNRADNKLITVEDHQVIGGMGSLLVHSLKQAGYEFRLKSLGIGGEFGRSAYQADQLYDNFQLSAEGVWRAYLKL
jgi:transketolase